MADFHVPFDCPGMSKLEKRSYLQVLHEKHGPKFAHLRSK